MKHRPYGVRVRRPNYRALHPPWRPRHPSNEIYNRLQDDLERGIGWKVLRPSVDLYAAQHVTDIPIRPLQEVMGVLRASNPDVVICETRPDVFSFATILRLRLVWGHPHPIKRPPVRASWEAKEEGMYVCH